MKKVKLVLYSVVPLLCGTTALFGLYCYVARSMRATPVLYSFDTLFAEEQKKRHTATLTDLLRTHGPQAVVAQPDTSIKNITCTYKPTGSAHICVHAHTPYLVVNHTSIMTDTGLLVPADSYTEEIVQSLPTVTVPASYLHEDRLPQHIYAALRGVADDVWFDYNVAWHDDHALVVRPQKNKDLCFVYDPHTGVLEKSSLMACHNAAQSYTQEKRTPKKLIVDTRFADQIIVYGDTGGYSHGAGTG